VTGDLTAYTVTYRRPGRPQQTIEVKAASLVAVMIAVRSELSDKGPVEIIEATESVT